MRYLYLFVLLWSFSIVGKAQDCPEGTLFLSTQADVDNFSALYPDCIEMDGNLIISGSNIQNLDGLSQLRKVGSINIGSTSLINLSGLDSLLFIDGFININNNADLSNVEALNLVDSVSDYVKIQDNASLVSINTFNNLKKIGGELLLFNNSALENLDGFADSLIVEGNVDISQNPQLSSLAGFGLETIWNSNITIRDNNSLTDLNGLDFLSSIRGDLIISENYNILSLVGLESVLKVEGVLEISAHTNLESIAELSNLESCGGLKIMNSLNLTDLSYLSNLDSINGPLEIAFIGITSLNGLQNVKYIQGDAYFHSDFLNEIDYLQELDSIGGNLRLNSSVITSIADFTSLIKVGGGINLTNSGLLELGNFPSLISIGGRLSISYISFLVNLENFPSLQKCGDLTLLHMENFVSLEGLENIVELGTLNIEYCFSFENLEPLVGLNEIGGIYLLHCDSLSSLEGLNNIEAVNGIFKFWSCDNLTDISALSNLETIGHKFTLGDMPLLNLDGLNSLESIGGDIFINNTLLNNISALSNLSSTEGELNLRDNESLTSLNGLQNLLSIDGNLIIENNDILNNIDSIANIDPSGVDDIEITYNGQLSACAIAPICSFLSFNESNLLIEFNGAGCQSNNDLIVSCTESPCGLYGIEFYNQQEVDDFAINYPDCYQIDGVLRIEGDDIVDLSPLSSITTVIGGLVIEDCDSLLTLYGLHNLETVGNGLAILLNLRLENMDDLANLESFNGALTIRQNQVLTSIEGLSNVNPSSINGYLRVYNNASLQSCASQFLCNAIEYTDQYINISNNTTGCNSIEQVSDSCAALSCFPNGLVISSQDELDHFDEYYPICTSIIGDLTISGDDIISIDNISFITEITGSLIIENNPILEIINTFSFLEVVDGDFILNNNPLLTEILSFQSLQGLFIDSVAITNNESLTDCQVAGLCDYVVNDLGGTYIANNGDGCNDVIEITENCNNLSCINGYLTLTTQSAVDSFSINYPFCTQINGDLYIITDSISNVDGLSQIEYISGRLEFYSDPENTNLLNDISGLINLDSIGDELRIQNTTSLTSLYGLNSLKQVGRLYIKNNDALVEIEALGNLSHVGDYVWIDDNYSLTSLIGLEGIDSVYSMSIANNHSLIDMTGLNNLTFSFHSVYIGDDSSLVSLNGLDSFNGINNYVSNANTDLILINNPLLESFDLPSFINVGSVEIDNCPSVQNINGLEALLGVEFLKIQNCPSLSTLSGLDNLLVVNSFRLQNCPSLESLSALESLIQIDYLVIDSCLALVDLQGLEEVSSIAYGVEITHNEALESLEGLNSLNGVGADFSLVGNNSLDSIVALSSLQYINGELKIENNQNLLSLTGLEEVDPSSIESLYFLNNPNLSFCSVFPVCEFSENSMSNIVILGNSPGCNSIDEVQLYCGLSYCGTGGITLTSQVDVDIFLLNNPGCTAIDGDLIIQGEDINNLSGLQSLELVNGNLIIGNIGLTNNQLENVIGLNNIFQINGNLEIINNSALTNLASFSDLVFLNGDLIIQNNEMLTTLSGLENISTDSLSGINISNNDSLSYCQIASVCEYIDIQPNNVTIEGNYGNCSDLTVVEDVCLNGACLSNGITFSSQFQIDNFSTQYPDCDVISGDVTIYGSDITNLDGLGQILVIEGHLKIGDFSGVWDYMPLEYLNGLENLVHVGSNLYVLNNTTTLNLDALESLVSIGGGLDLWNSLSLESIDGLSNLQNIGSYIYIKGTLIEDLSVLHNIESINGFIKINGNPIENLYGLNNISPNTIAELTIENNYLLSDCAIDNFCQYIDFNIDNCTIYNNAEGCDDTDQVLAQCNNVECLEAGISFNSQYDLDQFSINYPNCTDIIGDVEISGADISDLSALISIMHIQGDLIIEGNEMLNTLEGLNSVIELNGVIIGNNIVLANIEALSSISPESISDLYINNNPVLDQCAIFSICGYLGLGTGNVSISNNGLDCSSQNEVEYQCLVLGLPMILSTQGEVDAFNFNCPDCSFLNSDLIIEGDDIVNVDSLSSIIGVAGNVYIGGESGNPLLEDLAGLANLVSIGNDLIIENNLVLSSIGEKSGEEIVSLELDSLSGIGGDLIVKENPELVNFTGMEKLSTIGGNLEIIDNDALNSLIGLENLNSESIFNLLIENNPKLSTCHVTSVCNYLTDPIGDIVINGNSEGCMNTEKVESKCLSLDFDSPITIYPNPASSTITIARMDEVEIIEFSMYDVIGRRVYFRDGDVTSVDISTLRAGSYIIQIKTNDSTYSTKLVVEN